MELRAEVAALDARNALIENEKAKLREQLYEKRSYPPKENIPTREHTQSQAKRTVEPSHQYEFEL